MNWIVKIVNEKNEIIKNQRILVKFEPLKEEIIFIGQNKQNMEWVDFCEESNIMDIDLERIQSILLSVYNTMKKRLDAYNNIAEGFTVIKFVEFKEEEIE